MRRVIANGSHAIILSDESKDRLRCRRRASRSESDDGALCAEGNEAPAHAGSIRARCGWPPTMLAMTWASEIAGPPRSRAAPGGCATRDGCPQSRFRWNGGLWRFRSLAAGPRRQRQIGAGCRKRRPAMQDGLRNSNTTGRRHCRASSPNARRDIELLQRLEQERVRAERLEQGLAAARSDVETADRAGGESGRRNRPG